MEECYKGKKLLNRCTEYFEKLINVNNQGEAMVAYIGIKKL